MAAFSGLPDLSGLNHFTIKQSHTSANRSVTSCTVLYRTSADPYQPVPYLPVPYLPVPSQPELGQSGRPDESRSFQTFPDAQRATVPYMLPHQHYRSHFSRTGPSRVSTLMHPHDSWCLTSGPSWPLQGQLCSRKEFCLTDECRGKAVLLIFHLPLCIPARFIT